MNAKPTFMLKRITVIIFFLLFVIPCVIANALNIRNLTRDSLAQTVTFEIEWKNSWRVSNLPNNWDAVWVFVKFIDCNANASTQWTHGILSSTITNHNFGNLSPVLSDGSAIGIDAGGLGVMLRRNAVGFYGNSAATTVTLNVTNMLQNTAYTVRVVGIEMIFVPEGAYQLGSLINANSFATTTTSNNTTPININSESAITLNAHNLSGGNETVDLPATYPKGFGAFHCMKYELSEGQYATFLNTISVDAQINRYLVGYGGAFRNQLQNGMVGLWANYTSDREDRAQNFLGWDDLMAYLDWAALRPMTEMEYEKVCRGTLPMVAEEYVWGTTNLYELTQISSPENGTEMPNLLPANAHCNYNNIIGGDGGNGPVRVGIFALPTNLTRESSGAGYYGALELAGNVNEPCIEVSNLTSTTGIIVFDITKGDGVLSSIGNHNQANWPTTAQGGYILRGGSWSTPEFYLRTSDRSAFGTWNGLRHQAVGGRGIR